MKKILILLFVLLSSCSLNKVVLHHGVHNLEKKQTKLKVNYTNKNDIIRLIGPPSTESNFDNEVYIYIERKTSGSKLTKLGEKKLIKNDVLILEIDNTGILLSKKFYNKDDMKDLKIVKATTETGFKRDTFLYNFMSSMRQKINDPLNKRAEKQKEISQR